MNHALELRRGHECLFVSNSRWLHPLFELEDFLRSTGLPPGELEVRDRVVGRAAALVQVHLGIGSVHAGLLSEGGRRVLETFRVRVTFERLVERIGCQTEALLADEVDPRRAYRMLRQRAGLEGVEEASGTGTGTGGRGRDRGGLGEDP